MIGYKIRTLVVGLLIALAPMGGSFAQGTPPTPTTTPTSTPGAVDVPLTPEGTAVLGFVLAMAAIWFMLRNKSKN